MIHYYNVSLAHTESYVKMLYAIPKTYTLCIVKT